MVHLFPLTLLTLLASAAFAGASAEQQVLDDTSVQLSEKWSYDDCGEPSNIVQIKSIALRPDPPKPGQDLTVIVSASARDTIEEGAYADVIVKLGLIKLLSKRFDLCQEARSANASIQCPVDKGDYVISQTVALPREIPRAKFNVHVDAFTNDDEDILCLNLVVDFGMFSFPRVW